MLLEERLTQISQLVDKQGSATIDFLATQFKVSKDTIRRDLMKLEGRKKLNRVHGGAIPIGKEAEIFNYEERSHISSQ
ncbi:MAG: DeoR/GlpR transcriptional regulator, partial [Bacillus sp. (in: Bacteria)]|nr:DeoR/GlpR transcriptional regulator [Bacillus sp. (in: firmicutes)]